MQEGELGIAIEVERDLVGEASRTQNARRSRA